MTVSTEGSNSEPVTSASQVTGGCDLGVAGNRLTVPVGRAAMIEMGERLLAERTRRRGTFKAWVASECAFSFMSASRYMRLAEEARSERRPQGSVWPALEPRRTAEATATDDELDEFAATIATIFNGGDMSRPVNSFAMGIALAIENGLTWGELLVVARRASVFALMLKLSTGALIGLADKMPADGLVASCELAERSAEPATAAEDAA